jgi:hypothetical protein
MAQIILDLPDELAERLEPYQDRLAEWLERGLQDVLTEPRDTNELGTEDIISLLASQPSPEQILAIRPSPLLQDRVSTLLAQSKAGTLTTREEAELERYLTIEHLVRLAKAHAYGQLQQTA